MSTLLIPVRFSERMLRQARQSAADRAAQLRNQLARAVRTRDKQLQLLLQSRVTAKVQQDIDRLDAELQDLHVRLEALNRSCPDRHLRQMSFCCRTVAAFRPDLLLPWPALPEFPGALDLIVEQSQAHSPQPDAPGRWLTLSLDLSDPDQPAWSAPGYQHVLPLPLDWNVPQGLLCGIAMEQLIVAFEIDEPVSDSKNLQPLEDAAAAWAALPADKRQRLINRIWQQFEPNSVRAPADYEGQFPPTELPFFSDLRAEIQQHPMFLKQTFAAVKRCISQTPAHFERNDGPRLHWEVCCDLVRSFYRNAQRWTRGAMTLSLNTSGDGPLANCLHKYFGMELRRTIFGKRRKKSSPATLEQTLTPLLQAWHSTCSGSAPLPTDPVAAAEHIMGDIRSFLLRHDDFIRFCIARIRLAAIAASLVRSPAGRPAESAAGSRKLPRNRFSHGSHYVCARGTQLLQLVEQSVMSDCPATELAAQLKKLADESFTKDVHVPTGCLPTHGFVLDKLKSGNWCAVRALNQLEVPDKTQSPQNSAAAQPADAGCGSLTPLTDVTEGELLEQQQKLLAEALLEARHARDQLPAEMRQNLPHHLPQIETNWELAKQLFTAQSEFQQALVAYGQGQLPPTLMSDSGWQHSDAQWKRLPGFAERLLEFSFHRVIASRPGSSLPAVLTSLAADIGLPQIALQLADQPSGSETLGRFIANQLAEKADSKLLRLPVEGAVPADITKLYSQLHRPEDTWQPRQLWQLVHLLLEIRDGFTEFRQRRSRRSLTPANGPFVAELAQLLSQPSPASVSDDPENV
ncbi:MAG: hypothetical protein ACKO3T_26185 [Planctomycetaceae bacterium]